jgi:hypothetical protein
MSAEDCILYRKIGDDWCVLGYGFTFAEAELDDYEFRKASRIVPLERLFHELEVLNKKYVTEFGICYSGEFISDPPPEVPEDHRLLCCVPDSECSPEKVDCLTDGRRFFSKTNPDRCVEELLFGVYAMYERCSEKGFHRGVCSRFGAFQWLNGEPRESIDGRLSVAGVTVE